jgi:phosphoribosylformylglycinamidine cyclo-ligase
MAVTYADAGVDIRRANEIVRRIRELAARTYTPEVLKGHGLFAGLFQPEFAKRMREVVAATVDGIGTKLMVALMSGDCSQVGRCLVHHCINDLLVQGAKPLFFLDYVAGAKLEVEIVVQIVAGLAAACEEQGLVLLGGETAEMPGVYREGQYDLVGTVFGSVDEDFIITGEKIKPGDAVIGLASNGLHTNGFSLARKVLFEIEGRGIHDQLPWGPTVAEELLRTHICYLPIIEPLLGEGIISGMAHITGGGLLDNVIRVLPKGCMAVLDQNKWPTPEIFTHIKRVAEQPDDDYFWTFNAGVGMALVVRSGITEMVIGMIEEGGCAAWEIGKIIEGDHAVVIN